MYEKKKKTRGKGGRRSHDTNESNENRQYEYGI